MASKGESKLPLPSSVKEKRRSHLPSPKSFRKSPSKPLTPDPLRRHGTPEHTAASMSTDLSPESPYRLGSRVCIAGVKPGILQYYGRTKFAEGEWCGIELDDCEGKHNGTVDGLTYFSCKEGHGIFAPSYKVQPLNEWVLPERPSKLQQPKTSGVGIPKPRASRSKSPEEIPPNERKLKRSLGDLTSGDSSSLPQSPRFVSKLARPKSIGCDPRIHQRASPSGEEGEDDQGKFPAERSPVVQRPVRTTKQTSGLPIKRSHSALEPSDVKKYHSAIPKPGSKKEPGSTQGKAAVKSSGEILLTQSEYNEATRNVSRSERAAKSRSLSYDLTTEGQLPLGLGPAPKDSVLRSSSSSLCSRSSSGSLISPLPDKTGRTLVQTKRTPLAFGGEAMSEPEDDPELLGATKLSHASSLGILPDSVLCNNSLITDDLRGGAGGGKGHIKDDMECKESTEMMEKDLDQEISGISTPEIDMSGSTISGKDLCSSPELEGKRDLENNYGAESADVKGQAQAGEMPASPGSSESSPNSEIQISSKDNINKEDTSAQSKSKEASISTEESVTPSLQGALQEEDSEQYPHGMRTSIDLEDLDSSSMTASVEIAKTAVQQYAELMAAAERERRASLKHREARKAARREAERARSVDSDEEAFVPPKTEQLSDRVAMDTERTQLLVDLQAGHTKRDRPVSMISIGSADTGIVADLPATPSKKERPLSLVSTSSVDTGYQPDTDSEIGTLTMNSPLEDESLINNNQTEELSPRSEALSLDAAYKDTFSRFQKVVQKGTMRENEITSDMYSDTGTLVGETETEEVEGDIQDLIIQNTLLEYGLEEMLQCVPLNRGAHNGSPVEDGSPDFTQETPGSSTEEEDLALYEGTQTPLSDIHVPMETIPEQDTPESPEVEFPGQKDNSITNNDTTSTVSVTSDIEGDTELTEDLNNAKGTSETMDNATAQTEALDNAKDSALLDIACNNPPATMSTPQQEQNIEEGLISSTEQIQLGKSPEEIQMEVNQNEPISVATTLPRIEDAPISSSKDQVATLDLLDNRDKLITKYGPIDVQTDVLVNRVEALSRSYVQGLPPPDEPETMVVSSQEESGMSEIESPSSPVREVNKNVPELPDIQESVSGNVQAEALQASDDDKILGNVTPAACSGSGDGVGTGSGRDLQLVKEDIITPIVAESVEASLPSTYTPDFGESLIHASPTDHSQEKAELTESMVEQLILPGLSEHVSEKPTEEGKAEECVIPAASQPMGKESISIEEVEIKMQECIDKQELFAKELMQPQGPSVIEEQTIAVLEDPIIISEPPCAPPEVSAEEPTKTAEPQAEEELKTIEKTTELLKQDVIEKDTVATTEVAPQLPAPESLEKRDAVTEEPELCIVAKSDETETIDTAIEPTKSVETKPNEDLPVPVVEEIIQPVEYQKLDREPPKLAIVEDLIQPAISEPVEKPFLQSNIEDLIQPSQDELPVSNIVLDKKLVENKESVDDGYLLSHEADSGVLPTTISDEVNKADTITKEVTDAKPVPIQGDTHGQKEASDDAEMIVTSLGGQLPEQKPDEPAPQAREKDDADLNSTEESTIEPEEKVTEEPSEKVTEDKEDDTAIVSTDKSEAESSRDAMQTITKERTFTIDEDKDIVHEDVEKEAETLIDESKDDTKEKIPADESRNGIVADQDVLVETLEITGPVIRTSTPVIDDEVPEEEAPSKMNATSETSDVTSENLNLTSDTDGTSEKIGGEVEALPGSDSLNTTFSEGEQMPMVEIEIVSEMSESTIKDQGPTEKELIEKKKASEKAKELQEKEKAGESSGDERKKKNGVTKTTKGKRIEDVAKAEEKKPTKTTRSTLNTKSKLTTSSTKTSTTKDSDKTATKNRLSKTNTTKPSVSSLRKTDTDKKTPTPKVSPRITDLNRRPAPKKPSDNTIIVNNVKTAKNNTNLKKADSSAVKSAEKKAPVPSIKRNPPPKSKWGNIMSQIDSSKPTKKPAPPTKTTEVKPRTKPTVGGSQTLADGKTTKTTKTTTTTKTSSSTSTSPRSPRDVTARSTTTARRTSSANTAESKTKTSTSLKVTRPSSLGNAARSKQSPETTRPDSRMSNASEASGLNTSQTGSLAGSRPNSAGKPENRKTASLRREKSPSVCSESSTSSQISSQGSRTVRTKTKEPVPKTEPVKAKSTTSALKRRSIVEPTTTGKDTRRSSLATSARQTKKDTSPAPTSDKKASSEYSY